MVVVYYFFVGCAFYHWRDYIPVYWGYFWLACLVATIALATPRGAFVAPVFLTYVTVMFGTLSAPRLPLLQSGDYSYGIYLYGFPILQALVAAFPSLTTNAWWLAVVGGVITTLFAVTSWHLIEFPVLSLKRHFSSHTIPQTPEARL